MAELSAAQLDALAGQATVHDRGDDERLSGFHVVIETYGYGCP